ncbi:MAG: DUF1490 family protein [Sporichthyaceae bacterium]
MAALFVGSLAGKLVHYAIAGTAGNLIVKGAAAARPWAVPAARRAAVRTVAAGIVGGRRLGDWAEEARLQAGDLVADARASLGETAPPPGEEPAAPVAAAEVPAAAKKPARRAAPRKSAAADHGHDH